MLVFTLLMNLTGPRARRLETDLHVSSLPKIDAFLREVASGAGWDEPSAERLRSAGEETLSSLLPLDTSQAADAPRNLIISARGADSRIELEFVATSAGMDENLEDRLAYLGDQMQIEDDRELSFRLLRHYASSVHHRKYHEIDIVTIEVDAARSA